MDTSNKEFQPSDFWPGAEKMLDAHFKKKRTIKRWSFLVTLFLLIVGSTTWWMLRSEDNNSKTKKRSLYTNQQNHVPNQTLSSSNSLEDKTNDAQSFNNKIESKSKNAEATNSIEGIEEIKEQQPENKSSLDNETLNSSIKSNQKNTNTAFDLEADKQEKEDPRHQTATSLQNTKTSLDLDNKVGGDFKNQTEASPTNGITKVDSSAVGQSVSQSNSKPVTKSAIQPIQSVSFQTLDVMQIRNYSPIAYNYFSDSLAMIEIQKIDYLLPKTKNLNWRLMAYSGFFISNPKVSYATNADYVNKRNSEESTMLNNSAGIELARIMGKWNVSAGLEFNQYGESTNYKNQVIGNIQSVNFSPITVVDSTIVEYFNYYQGNEYTQTQTVLSFDTLLLSDTTNTTGLINGNLPESYNTKNRYTYIEIPIRLGYQWFQSGRISSEVYGGLSLGMFQKASGYLPNRELSAFEQIEDQNEFRKYIVNYRLGMSASYRFYKNLSLTAAVEHRNMLQSIWKSSYGVNQRYRAVGLQLGLRWAF